MVREPAAGEDTESNQSTINRRRVLQGMGAVSAAALAGCGGGDGGDGGGDGGDGGGGELGERVPTIPTVYWAASGTWTNIHEAAIPPTEDALGELGVSLNVEGVEPLESSAQVFNDERNHQLVFYTHTFPPDRLDPDEMTRRFAADWAGADGNSNVTNYANCEYTHPAIGQRTEPDIDSRREMVMEAHKIMSEEVGSNIPLFRNVSFAGVRTNEVDLDGVGDNGYREQNAISLIKSSPASGNSYTVATTRSQIFETTNYPTIAGGPGLAVWGQIVHSPLVAINEEFELTNILAESYDVSDDGLTITVNLRDATFHNGDPITAEDVAFTFQQISDNADVYSLAVEVPYDSIDPVDEKTVEFNMEEPFPPLITKIFTRWGILHKDTWVDGGAVEDPQNFSMDPIVASGAFKVDTYRQGEFMVLEPHEGHPVYSPSHELTMQGFSNTNTAFQAFGNNEVQAMTSVPPGQVERVQEEIDGGEIITARGFTCHQIYPQYNFGTTKFEEFRKAVGMSLDRQLMNDLAYNSLSDPILYSAPLLDNSPWINADELYHFTDDPTGDIEGAKQMLEDAGWGWDDNGNLHYPPDADLSPLWPQGEEANADLGYECLTADGAYAGPP